LKTYNFFNLQAPGSNDVEVVAELSPGAVEANARRAAIVDGRFADLTRDDVTAPGVGNTLVLPPPRLLVPPPEAPAAVCVLPPRPLPVRADWCANAL